MKKLLLFAAIVMSMCMYAKDEQKIFVKSGDVSFLQEPVLALNEIDFSKTQIVEYNKDMSIKVEHGTFEQYNAERGQDFVNDWSGVQKTVKKFGLNKFTNKKGLWTAYCTPEEMALLSEKEKKTLKNLGVALPIDRQIKYICKIVVDTIDLGNASGAVMNKKFKIGGCIISGSMEVVNMEDNSIVCSLDFKYCKGDAEFSETNRMSYAIVDLYTEMLKELKKKK